MSNYFEREIEEIKNDSYFLSLSNNMKKEAYLNDLLENLRHNIFD